MSRGTTATAGTVEAHTRDMEAIVAEYETPLLRYAARIVNSPTAAQDVVQNVFVKLFRAQGKGVDPVENLKSWLYRVTHNEAVDHVCREVRHRALHEKHAETAEVCSDGDACDRSATERKALVLHHLKKLHPREQQVVLLRLEEGLSYSEISEITGRSEGNVGNILHHAVKKLSERLRRSGAIPDTTPPVRHAQGSVA